LDTLLSLSPQLQGLSILCGKGNNGGDGYWVAVLAKRLGIPVQLIALAPKEELRGDARDAREQAIAAGMSLEDSDADFRYPVIVDALLGTGGHGAPRPSYAQAITRINEAQAFVLSLDLPSGLNADTGAAQLAVQADATVSFIARKVGLFTGRGPALCGQRFFSDLGVAASYAQQHPHVPLRHWHEGLMPKVPTDAYKHQRGHVVIVGGCKGMGGAVILAAQSALCSGAGLVSVATDAANIAGLQARVPEAMWIDPLVAEDDRSLTGVLATAGIVVFGPGLGRGPWAAKVMDALAAYQGPMLVDADGLYWLAKHQQQGAVFAPQPLFLTPHAGEAATLLGTSVAEVAADPFAAVAAMASTYQARCLLKGPGSIFGDADGVSVCGHGNPGMATAGMGDVLAGLAASLIVQQPQNRSAGFDAGVLLHSAAADRAALELGARGLTASAVIPSIGALLHEAQTC
jgi:NAD(P)H-hydrate epimerase